MYTVAEVCWNCS